MVTLHEKLQCSFSNDTSKPEVIAKKICQGTDCLKAAFRSGITSLQVMVASERIVGWGSQEAVTLLYLVPWPSSLTLRVGAHDSKRYDSHQ
jgi:hypothetical protein